MPDAPCTSYHNDYHFWYDYPEHRYLSHVIDDNGDAVDSYFIDDGDLTSRYVLIGPFRPALAGPHPSEVPFIFAFSS